MAGNRSCDDVRASCIIRGFNEAELQAIKTVYLAGWCLAESQFVPTAIVSVISNLLHALIIVTEQKAHSQQCKWMYSLKILVFLLLEFVLRSRTAHF